MKREPRDCLAFTLIELLAVIVIAALVLAVGGWSLSTTSERTVLARTIASIQHMDARARLHARSSGEPVILHVDGNARTLRLATSDDEVLSEMFLVEAIELTVEKAGGDSWIVFDARGRSIDYAVVLRAQGGRMSRLAVHGLTGAIAATREATT